MTEIDPDQEVAINIRVDRIEILVSAVAREVMVDLVVKDRVYPAASIINRPKVPNRVEVLVGLVSKEKVGMNEANDNVSRANE